MPQRGIDIALDLSRMPALARRCATMPVPNDILEVIQIAAGQRDACDRVARESGVREQVLVLSARFFLQHLLFSSQTDCWRVLGLLPGASRQTARLHMKLLLDWLHPDRNSELDSVYADRVIEAWRRVSSEAGERVTLAPPVRHWRKTTMAIRPPLVELSDAERGSRPSRFRVLKVLAAGFALMIATSSFAYYFEPDLLDSILAWKP